MLLENFDDLVIVLASDIGEDHLFSALIQEFDCGDEDLNAFLAEEALSEGNRMIRVGFGQHEHKWFARIDLWWVALRLTA